MKAKLSKRVVAYLIDMVLLLILFGIMSYFFQSEIDNQIKINNTNYVNGIITFDTFIDNANKLYMESDKQKIVFYLINIVYIIGYFVILPLYINGSTLGKKVMGIKVEASYNQKLTFKSLFIRNLVINGLLYLIVVVLTLYLLPPNIYFPLISVVSFIQITLVIISIFMVLYRQDKRGIHDLLAHTKVVTIK